MIIQRILFTALLATAIAATHIYDVSAAEKNLHRQKQPENPGHCRIRLPK